MAQPLFLLAVMLALAMQPSSSMLMKQALHSAKLDVSQYVAGRSMIINPCFVVLDDPATTFNFSPDQLTIAACNTYSCPYSLDGLAFSLAECSQSTHNNCPDDPAQDYIQRFKNTTNIVLLANLITFSDAKGGATMQLKDVQ